jgi:hypothetical protein
MGDEFTPDTGLGGGEEDPKMVQISTEDWQAIQTKMSDFEKKLSQGFQTPVAPAAPAVAPGPSVDEMVGDIEKEIEAIDDEIEERISNGQSVKALRAKQRKLQAKATKIQIEAESINPLRDIGLGTMGQLSLKMVQSDMPHLDVVKDTFDEYYNQLTGAQKSDPEILKKIYNLAVGQNYDAVVRKEAEIANRQKSQATSLDVGNKGRSSKTADKAEGDIPDWRDYYSGGSLLALERKGIDMDREVQRRGYKDWKEYYEAHKDYM